MTVRPVAAAVAAALLWAAPALAAAPPDSVVARLYRDFPIGGSRDLVAAPRPVLLDYFEDGLAELLMREDGCRARTAEVCNLDFDLMWASQDPSAAGLSIRPLNAREVAVGFRTAGGEPVALRYSLAATARGVRIRDVTYPRGRSLRVLLGRR
jgi:hypothetical protein